MKNTTSKIDTQTKQKYQDILQNVIQSLHSFETSAKDQINIFRILVSIMYLGNIDFIEKSDDSCEISENNILIQLAHLLSIDSSDLEKVLLYRSIVKYKFETVT